MEGEQKQCQRCSSPRIVHAYGNTDEQFSASMGVFDSKARKWTHGYSGYVPDDMNVQDGDEDSFGFNYCLECGQMQGQWPLPITKLEEDKLESLYD